MTRNTAISIAILVLVVGTAVFFYHQQDEVEAEKVIGTQTQDTITPTTQDTTTPIMQNTTAMTQATLKTSKGDITLEFYSDIAPNAVDNFLRLAGENYYDGIIFHRVIEGFMIQGGDPTGTGTGGPGYTFADELVPESEVAQRGYVRGTLAMANAGPDTNGSQFFIMHQDQALPYNYTIFGRVTSGMEVVDAIAAIETDSEDKPLEDVVIENVELTE